MSLIQTAAKPSSPLNTLLAAFNLSFGVVNVTNSEDFNTISTLTLDDLMSPGQSDMVYSSKRNVCYISCGFGSKGIFIVDLSDEENPQEHPGPSQLVSTNVRGIAIDEERDLLFALNGNSGNAFVYVYDISNPLTPVILAQQIVDVGGTRIQEAAGVGYDPINQLLFIGTLAENGRFAIMDMSNPSAPVTLSITSNTTAYRLVYAIIVRPEIHTVFLSCVGPSGNTGQIVSVGYGAGNGTPSAPVVRHILDDDNWGNTWTAELIPDKDILLGTSFSNVGGSIRFALYDISDPDLMVKGVEVIDDDLDSVVAAEYDRTRSVVFFSHINAGLSNQRLISSYEITDVNTVNKLHTEIWVTA